MDGIGALETAFELHEELGSGGFGTVYRATARSTGRAAAVKRAHAGLDAGERERISREVGLLAGFTHPRLAQLLGVYVDREGRPALAYELVEGQTLDRCLEAGRLETGTVATLVADVAEALDALHARGLVHRDVKAANVMVEPDGRARLLDFGLLRSGTAGATVTATGILVGTPEAMAPELLAGARPGPAVDVYALACLAWRMLAGEPVFAGSVAEQIAAHLGRDPPALSSRRPGSGPALDRVLALGLAKDPARRPAAAGEFASALAGALQSPAPAGATLVVGPAPEARAAAFRQAPTVERGSAVPPPAPHLPPGVRPDPPRSSRTPPLVLGLVVLAGAALGTWPRGADAPASLPAGDPGGPAAAPTFDAAWGDAVGVDLARLRRTSPALHLYPWRWGAIVSRLPGVARFHAWVARGGRPEELEVESLARLRDLDEDFLEAGYPRPFHPFAYARPKAGATAFPARLQEWLDEGVRITGIDPGWHGTAVDALERFVVLHAEHSETARKAPIAILPPELAELKTRAVLSIFDEGELVFKLNREAFRATEAGPALRAWMRPLAEAAALASYAGSRAVEADGSKYQELWARFYGTAFHRIREAFFWDFASLAPEVALGGPPGSLAAWHLHANFLDAFGDMLHVASPAAAGESGPYRDEVEALAKVMELPARNGYGGQLKVVALRHAFLCPGRRMDQAGLREALRRFGTWLEGEGSTPLLRHWAAMDFAKEIHQRDMAATMTRDELRRIRGWLDAMAPGTLSAPDADVQDKARAMLDRVLAEGRD